MSRKKTVVLSSTIKLGIVAAVLGVIAVCAAPARAEFSVGGSFAAPGYGARPWGMAGAAIASGADEASVYWNPAMLGLIDQHRVGLAYSNLIPGVDILSENVCGIRDRALLT